MAIFDDMKEIHSLAQRIITLAEGRGGESALKARAQVEHDHDERKTETRYAVGDLFAPKDGWVAGPFERPGPAFNFVPPVDEPQWKSTNFYIWRLKPGGGAEQIAVWGAPNTNQWLPINPVKE